MKIIGALIFIMMTTWIGYDWSLQLQKRTKQLRSLIYSLQLMEAEMGYTYAPLQKVFSSVHEKTTEPVSYFYKYLQQALTESVSDFSEVWEHALEKLLKQSALKQEEAAILSQFGKNLGNHTFLQQEKHIHLTMHHLKEILNNAIDEQHKYERMAKSLGVLAGIFIVLLLY